jgi:hypothetical protein
LGFCPALPAPLCYGKAESFRGRCHDRIADESATVADLLSISADAVVDIAPDQLKIFTGFRFNRVHAISPFWPAAVAASGLFNPRLKIRRLFFITLYYYYTYFLCFVNKKI